MLPKRKKGGKKMVYLVLGFVLGCATVVIGTYATFVIKKRKAKKTKKTEVEEPKEEPKNEETKNNND